MSGNVVPDAIRTYIEELAPEPLPALLAIERQAAAREPIVSRDVGRMLQILVRAVRPKRLLEIGCNLGYSSTWMALALRPRDRLTTIEIDPDMAARARANHKAAGVSRRVKVVVGPALDVLPALNGGPFDWLFLDAVKEEYPQYLELGLKKLRKGGIVLADNLLWSGRVVAEPPEGDPYASSTGALRAFNPFFLRHPKLEATILPVGDGLGFAVRI